MEKYKIIKNNYIINKNPLNYIKTIKLINIIRIIILKRLKLYKNHYDLKTKDKIILLN